jgi:SAM-dependent methyltransferase
MSIGLAGRVRRSFAKRGALGTARLAVQDVGRQLVRFRRYLEETRFDRRHGVATRGMVFWTEPHVRQDAAYEHATAYGGVRPNLFRPIMSSLAIEHQDFTFVDLGCGKGKALLLASELPFRRIVGVELSDELVAAARRNAPNYRSASRRCDDIEVVCQDAGAFSFPEGPGVYYMNNPFYGPVMKRVLENLEVSLRERPRPAYVVYQNPVLEQMFEEAPFLERLNEVENAVIYRAC